MIGDCRLRIQQRLEAGLPHAFRKAALREGIPGMTNGDAPLLLQLPQSLIEHPNDIEWEK